MKNDDSVMATRERLLKLLAEKEGLLKEYQENYIGPGLFKKLKRLIRYRDKYLRHCFSKFKPHLIKSKTFWGENFLTVLPQDMECYYFGALGGPEIKLTKFLIKNLDANSVFYDIGTNHGYYSLLAKKISDAIEVHSFEPAPEIFEILKENLSEKQGVFLNNVALSNSEGQMDFYYTKKYSGSSTIDASGIKSAASFDFHRIKVQAITLDNYCDSHLKPNFLKIDVEGAESRVIEGGAKALTEGNPTIAMEVWKRVSGDNTSHLKAIEILYDLGYKSYKINNEGELEFIEKIDPERDILEGDKNDNFIFKKL